MNYNNELICKDYNEQMNEKGDNLRNKDFENELIMRN